MDSASDPSWEAAEFVEPRNGCEAAVASIWGELLGIERVGANDNFLLLGGESLAATQAAARIQEQFSYSISIRSIFVKTVTDVAAEILAQYRKDAGPG